MLCTLLFRFLTNLKEQDSKESSPRSLERLLLGLKILLTLKILLRLQYSFKPLSTIWFDSLICLNLFRVNIVTIHMILKYASTCSESIWYEFIQFLNMSRLEIKTWWNTLKFEQMAHEKAKGQQAEKLFLGSLRASRAIKNLNSQNLAGDSF